MAICGVNEVKNAEIRGDVPNDYSHLELHDEQTPYQDLELEPELM